MKILEQVRRFDLGEIGKIEVMPQGFLKVPGFVTRTGVFTYKDREGKVRRELRHPDDVFAPESLATLKYAPVTLDHPPVMITPENVSEYSKGHATERVEVNRDLVASDLIIEAEDAIDAVQNGKRELSSGYLADLIEESGVYMGTEYDFRQKNIKYNHIAIVDRGRAGPEVRLRLDSADAVMEEIVEMPAAEFSPEGENDSENEDSWNESSHKRKSNGEFGSGAGSSNKGSRSQVHEGHTIEKTGGKYSRIGKNGESISSQNGQETYRVTNPEGKLLSTEFSSAKEAKKHINSLVGKKDSEDDEKENDNREVVVSGRNVSMPHWLADIWEEMSDRYDQMKGQIMKMEESMNVKRKDADISQKNVSPQVNVVQKAPDGRESAGKFGPSDKMGPSRAKGTADAEPETEEKKKDGDEHGVFGGVQKNGRDSEEEKKKEDEEEKEEKEKKDYEGLGGDGVAASPVQQLKDAMEQMKSAHHSQMDAMQAKLDEYASASMGAGEHKMDSKEFRTAVSRRVSLERSAEKILDNKTVAKFDSMSDGEIRAAVIKHRHPNADLRGKSDVYLESRFDSIMETIEDSTSLRKEMGGALLDRTRMDAGESTDPRSKRDQAMKESRNLWQQPLSASKK